MTTHDLNPEPPHRRHGRRLLTVTGLYLIFAAYWALFPLTLLAALIGDLRRRRGWLLLRALIFLGHYLTCYALMLPVQLAQWLGSGAFTGSAAARDRLARWTVWSALRFTQALYFGGMRIYGATTAIEDEAPLRAGGPFILFMRHVSVADTLIPFVFVTGRHGIYLRHVMKRELLLDPVFDIGLHRVPTLFIRRQSGDAWREMEFLQHGTEDLGAKEAVVMWPEGTRFTPAKRERILAKLKSRDPEFHKLASGLEHTLPPHRGGPTALLVANEKLRGDVLFCAHTGFEGTQHIRSFVDGTLLGRTVRVKFWRVPFAEIPQGHDARIRWLYDRWGIMDRWIGETKTMGSDPFSLAATRTRVGGRARRAPN